MSANTPTVPPVETVQPPPPEGRLSGLAMVIDGELRVPAGVVDLESFRRWTLGEELPQGVRVSWLNGLLHIETPSGPSLPKGGKCAPPFPRPGVVIDEEVYIPGWVADLESFERWTQSEECPQNVRLSYLNGVLWIDRTMEQLYTHNRVKTEVTCVLGPLIKSNQFGLYLSDGMQLSNAAGPLNTVPDGLFVSYAALRSGQVRRVPGQQTGVVQLDGSPDMVLEVVSASSEEKDYVVLPVSYHRAGIAEFWRIDARGAELTFEVFHWEAGGYVLSRLPDGWCASAVFGKEFHLAVQPDPLGDPLFTLEMRSQPATP